MQRSRCRALRSACATGWTRPALLSTCTLAPKGVHSSAGRTGRAWWDTQTVLTPWSGLYAAFREWKGMRVASRVEISWTLPEGEFTYYHSEATVIEKLD